MMIKAGAELKGLYDEFGINLIIVKLIAKRKNQTFDQAYKDARTFQQQYPNPDWRGEDLPNEMPDANYRGPSKEVPPMLPADDTPPVAQEPIKPSPPAERYGTPKGSAF